MGVIPDQPSVLRLKDSLLLEIDDGWQAADRRYFSLKTMRELTHPEVLLEDLGPLRLAPIHKKGKITGRLIGTSGTFTPLTELLTVALVGS